MSHFVFSAPLSSAQRSLLIGWLKSLNADHRSVVRKRRHLAPVKRLSKRWRERFLKHLLQCLHKRQYERSCRYWRKFRAVRVNIRSEPHVIISTVSQGSNAGRVPGH